VHRHYRKLPNVLARRPQCWAGRSRDAVAGAESRLAVLVQPVTVVIALVTLEAD